MGRPAVSVTELVAGGMSLDEISRFCESGADPNQEFLWPVSRVWGMGFAWSSYIAQETFLNVCAKAGLNERSVISTDGVAPVDFDEVFSLATDDVMIFSSSGAGGTTAAAKRLEAAMEEVGILKHAAKDVNDVDSAICVGVELVKGTRWWPPAPKMYHLMSAVIHLTFIRRSSPGAIRAFLGLLQWFDLLQRCKLSLYQDVYSFARRDGEWTVVDVPTSVVNELLCGLMMAPYWAFDMTTPYLNLIGATDVSSVFGYGAAIAPASTDEIRKLARLDAKTGEHVTLAGIKGLEGKRNRLGTPHQLQLSMSDFHTILCLNADDDEHINLKEGRAFLTYLKWILRLSSRHGKRIVILVDSKVWIGAVTKGRSGSWRLNQLLRQAAALVLAGGLQLHLVFIPSEHNSSDAASRGRRPRNEQRNKRFRPDSHLQQKYMKMTAQHEANNAWLAEWFLEHDWGTEVTDSRASSLLSS